MAANGPTDSTAPVPFEEVILALCEKHGLTGIHVGGGPGHAEGHVFAGYAHWDGACAIGWGSTASAAIAAAIEDANAKRALAPVVPALTLGEPA